MDSVTIYIGLGSNIGDRLANLRRGFSLLTQTFDVVCTSSIYETEPWGYLNQPKFLNAVIQATTTKQPFDILSALKLAEMATGRVDDGTRWGPRIFDADLLFYGNQVYKTYDLEIPHPRIKERAFVLIPLAEIAPTFVDPVSHETIQRLTDLVDGQGEVKLCPGLRL